MSISSLCSSGTPSVSSGPPPKILYVATSRNDGGLERYSVQLAARLASGGADLKFACAPGEIVETLCRESGIKTLSLTTRNSADFHCARVLAAQIVTHGIEIVHVHSRRDYVSAVLGVALARRRLKTSGRRPKLILHAHMLRPLGSPLRLSGRFFLWGSDAVLANSETVHELLVKSHGLPRSFVKLLHNGVALDRFSEPHSPDAAALREQARREWAVSEEALVLGMVGRLDAKGQRLLLDVVPVLAALFPSLRIVLVGSEGIPGESARLAAQAEAGGFADRLVFTGPREDVPALLTAFDVLVHLPIDESFGLALAEAMAAGLPTVATDIGGCREVVQSGTTGYLVSPGNPTELIEAINRLLNPSTGQMRRIAMGQAGRRLAEEKFSLERQVQRLQSFYDDLSPVSTLSEGAGGRRSGGRLRWAAAMLAAAAAGFGVFTHLPRKHSVPHRTRYAHAPVLAMNSGIHSSHALKVSRRPEPHTP